ncbi:hypothetical protein TKK_0004808 [Trichogramma kaykai]
MRIVILFSALLLSLFSHQRVHSLKDDELPKEILDRFILGQEEFDDFEKDVGLPGQDLVLLVGSCKAREDFISDRASEFVDLTPKATILPHLMLNQKKLKKQMITREKKRSF